MSERAKSATKFHDVFICYAHTDNYEDTRYNKGRKYIDLLMDKLNSKKDYFSVFHDRKIPVGDDWDDDIINNLTRAKVAVVFLSNNFFGSDYILKKEAPILLYRRENENLKIIPVNIDDCSEIKAQKIPLLAISDIKGKTSFTGVMKAFSDVQFVNDTSKVLNDIDDTEVNKIMLKIKDEIVFCLQQNRSPCNISSGQVSNDRYVPPHKGIYEEKCQFRDAVKKSIQSIMENDKPTIEVIKEKIKRKDGSVAPDLASLVDLLEDSTDAYVTILTLKNIALFDNKRKNLKYYQTIFDIVLHIVLLLIHPEFAKALISEVGLDQDMLDKQHFNVDTDLMMQILIAVLEGRKPGIYVEKDQIKGIGQLPLTPDVIRAEDHQENTYIRLAIELGMNPERINKKEIEAELRKYRRDVNRFGFYLVGDKSAASIAEKIRIKNLPIFIHDDQGKSEISYIDEYDIQSLLRDFLYAE
jgi:hypothetical protein